MNRTQQRERKASQRRRLIDAMVEVVAERGYPRARIGLLIARAGVSRPTFYDYFRDREECFAAALGEVRQRLLSEVADAISARPAERATAVAVEALVSFAETEPAMARVLFGDAVAAGARALDVRDQMLLEIEWMIEKAYARLGEQAIVAEAPARIVLGAVSRLLAFRLGRHAELVGVRDELLRWIESYGRAIGQHRWRALTAAPPRTETLASGPGVLRPQPPAKLRRSGTGAVEDAEQRRTRVLLALAELASERGYAAVTVADIGALAGVEVRTFYRLFAGKREAFAALGEFYFQHVMALTAGAFFSARAWPERVVAAKIALAGCVEQNPALARTCFIEGHAGESGAPARVEQLTRAFTLFLSEGHSCVPGLPPYSPVVLEAIAHANFELIYLQARASSKPEIAGVLGHSLHLCLTPFIGPNAAGKLIERGTRPLNKRRHESGRIRAAEVRRPSVTVPGR